jgi:hypothetical protein
MAGGVVTIPPVEARRPRKHICACRRRCEIAR